MDKELALNIVEDMMESILVSVSQRGTPGCDCVGCRKLTRTMTNKGLLKQIDTYHWLPTAQGKAFFENRRQGNPMPYAGWGSGENP